MIPSLFIMADLWVSVPVAMLETRYKPCKTNVGAISQSLIGNASLGHTCNSMSCRVVCKDSSISEKRRASPIPRTTRSMSLASLHAMFRRMLSISVRTARSGSRRRLERPKRIGHKHVPVYGFQWKAGWVRLTLPCIPMSGNWRSFALTQKKTSMSYS